MNEDAIYAAIGGHVLALDAKDGTEIWRRLLKPSHVTTLVRRGGHLIVAAAGEVWCLESATGAVVWHNKLKGLGLGLVTLAGTQPQAQASEVSSGAEVAMLAAMIGSDAGCADGGSAGGCD